MCWTRYPSIWKPQPNTADTVQLSGTALTTTQGATNTPAQTQQICQGPHCALPNPKHTEATHFCGNGELTINHAMSDFAGECAIFCDVICFSKISQNRFRSIAS